MHQTAPQDFETKAELAPPHLELIIGGGETTPPTGALEPAGREPMSQEEILLGDVDDLARYRTEDGSSYEQSALDSILQNKVTAVKEGAIPTAVSEVRHQWVDSPERKGGLIMDLGRTAVQTAMRGSLFYKHPESQARGDVEVEYARHNQENLRPNVAHVMISPRMTEKDASPEVAKAEGLDETDSIQINWLDLAEDGRPKEARTESILAPDVPIKAWADMLADGENNIFKNSVAIRDPESAQAVMETFPQLEIPLDKLPEGTITILESVLPYIEDPEVREKVSRHIEELRTDQQGKHEAALNSAERWRDFDIATEQSEQRGYANAALEQFIESLDGRWGDEDRAIISRHRVKEDGQIRYLMSRELAGVLQNAQRNLILTAAAVLTGNRKVLAQMDADTASRIYENERAIQQAQRTGFHAQTLNTNNDLIASLNIRVGGGCLGENEARFLTHGASSEDSSDEDCEFISRSCPKCKAKNVRTRITTTAIYGACGCSAII